MTSEEPASTGLEERVRESLDAAGTGGLDAMMSFYRADAVWDTSPVGMGIHNGQAAIRDFFDVWTGPYDRFEMLAEEVRDLGHGVTLTGILQRAKPAGGTGFVDFRYAAVSIWKDGLMERTTNYTDLEEARAAAERLAEERR